MAEPDRVEENDRRVRVYRGKHWRQANKQPDPNGRFAVSHGTSSMTMFGGNLREISVVPDVYQTKPTAEAAREWAFKDEVCHICAAGES